MAPSREGQFRPSPRLAVILHKLMRYPLTAAIVQHSGVRPVVSHFAVNPFTDFGLPATRTSFVRTQCNAITVVYMLSEKSSHRRCLDRQNIDVSKGRTSGYRTGGAHMWRRPRPTHLTDSITRWCRRDRRVLLCLRSRAALCLCNRAALCLRIL